MFWLLPFDLFIVIRGGLLAMSTAIPDFRELTAIVSGGGGAVCLLLSVLVLFVTASLEVGAKVLWSSLH